MNGNADKDIAPAERIIDFCLGPARSQCLYIFAKLGLAELLWDGARDYREIAAEKGVNAGALYRLLRALATFHIVRETAPGRFLLTDLGRPLAEHAPDSVKAHVMVMNEELYTVWGHAMTSLTTGKNAFREVLGKEYFEWYCGHPDKEAVMHRAMHDTQRIINAAIVNSCDLSYANTVCDVGGGCGSLISLILQRYPDISGILFDQSSAIEKAKRGMGGPLPHCKFIVGDFFNEVYKHADIYILKLVLHDWDDEHACRILKTCREAMRADSKLLIFESILPSHGQESSVIDLWDFHLLVNIGGKERSFDNMNKLMCESEFAIRDVKNLMNSFYLIEVGR